MLYTVESLVLVFLVEIALAQAISPTATHFSVAWSVVCHIRALCLNRSIHLAYILHLRGPMTHCARWGSGEGEIWRGGVEPLATKFALAYL